MSALPASTSHDPNSEAALLEQGRRIRALHEIISCPNLTFDEQIDETLRLGCRLLGTEIGKVGRQDPENNISEFLNTVVMSDLGAKRGIRIPLDKTFCQITFSSSQSVAFSDVQQTEYRDHPAVDFLKMRSYIGCTISVHGKKFGTVNFANREPVERPFTEADRDLVNLIGSWISVMMERQLDAEELQRARDAAESANRAKSAFLAHMSHEIRTPLTSIIGYSEAALDDDQTAEEHEIALQIIRNSSFHLLQLINDILDISKIEAGELDIEKGPLGVTDLVNQVSAIIAGQATQKGIEFATRLNYPYPEIIQTDALRLRQILLNLASNAVKFTSAGKVELGVRYHASMQQLEFFVSDSGIGMTPEQIKKIFNPFVQADSSTTRRYGGTGLGLSLSKKLAEKMGAHIHVSSEPGKGSCFVLKYPLSETEAAGRMVTGAAAGATENPLPSAPRYPSLQGRILLAEDNEMSRKLVARYLHKAGITVDEAETGEEAVTLAQQNRYDLILMDMQMPVLSGVDAVRQLRAMGQQLPVIMLTANVSLQDRAECEAAGSNGFLTKPIDKKKFFEEIVSFL